MGVGAAQLAYKAHVRTLKIGGYRQILAQGGPVVKRPEWRAAAPVWLLPFLYMRLNMRPASRGWSRSGQAPGYHTQDVDAGAAR
jgi:hypothetical protein